jgi:hypothetical protein
LLGEFSLFFIKFFGLISNGLGLFSELLVKGGDLFLEFGFGLLEFINKGLLSLLVLRGLALGFF